MSTTTIATESKPKAVKIKPSKAATKAPAAGPRSTPESVLEFAEGLSPAGLMLWNKAAIAGESGLCWFNATEGGHVEAFEVAIIDSGPNPARVIASVGPTVIIGRGLTLDVVRESFQREADALGMTYAVSDGEREVARIKPKRKSAADRTKSAGRA